MSIDIQELTTASWTLRDYVSPGLRVVWPDTAFPHMQPGDALHHPWKYLRRDVPHLWYADERFPLMGFLNRDEATLLHNIALPFAGKPALEIGGWLGWSTCHLALAGVELDVIDPAHEDPVIRSSVERSLARSGVSDRVNLVRGRSPESIGMLEKIWSLFFIDGDHEAAAPLRDALACLPYAADDCAFVFHDLASPAVAAALRMLAGKGFHVVVYQTAQIMGLAWRGKVAPVAHIPDPDVAWQLPMHLAGLPVSGFDFKPPVSADYRRFGDIETDGEASKPSVCIVTNEIIGPFKNGGIGTAMTGLAELLAGESMAVTVLYTGGVWSPEIRLGDWQKHYAARGIRLAAVDLDETRQIAGAVKDRGFGVPWLVYRYLSQHRFDVVHFNDCCGEGSLALAAKKLGLAFHDSLLVVAMHSPSRWVLEANQTLPTALLLSAYHYAEQLSVACADMLWCPSTYLLDWARSRAFELPARTFVQQYAIPRVNGGQTGMPGPHIVKEIVFFGRLEERKGLRLFCNAIHLLRDELADRKITVTFLGKAGTCSGQPSLDYIKGRAADWRFPIRTITGLGQPEALEQVAGGDRLLVMPSPLDNSPCTVYEALSLGIPFLAARTGGIPELVDEADRDHVLFAYTTESLRNALRNALENGGRVAKPAVTQDETRRGWTAMHAHWRSLLPPHEPSSPKPLTFAAIIDHHAGDGLGLTFNALRESPSIRRYIVLNRSGEPVGMPSVDLLAGDADVVDGELAGIAEDAVLLIHSGVTIRPEALETMLQTLMAAPVDGLQPAGRIHGRRGSRVVPPLGGSAAFSLYEGVTFTGALLVRREALIAAKRGRAFAVESPFMGLADFCVTRNGRIWPYPEPVAERSSRCRIDVKSSLPARVAAYDDASPTDRYYMLSAGLGAVRHDPAGSKRAFALAAVDLGLGPLIRIGARALRRLRQRIR